MVVCVDIKKLRVQGENSGFRCGTEAAVFQIIFI